MSAARATKLREVVLYTGERARAVLRALDAFASFVPEPDRTVLRALVPGVRRFYQSSYYVTGYSMAVDVVDKGGGLTSVKLWFDSESKTLYAKTKLPVDEARRVIEDLIRVFYNYLFVLNAYYGRASWVNDDRALDLRKTLMWLHDVGEDIAVALPDLAVLDDRVVRDLVRILPNLRVEVELPPGVVSVSELWKHVLKHPPFYHLDEQRMGPYVANVDYSVDDRLAVYTLSVQLMIFDEEWQELKPGATLDVEIFGNIVRFWVFLSDLPSIEDIRWIVENRCYVAMEAVKLLENAYSENQKFLESIRFFRRIVEEACRQLGQQRGGSG
ncbi:MAG: hypothetical protein QXZ31_03625 [Thermofilaceae archaeon]